MDQKTPPEASTGREASHLGAFASLAFTVIWSASTLSNLGIAMFDTATGWYMANMSRDPMIVSLIQTATSLPLFLFTIPAGALTDLVNSRRLLHRRQSRGVRDLGLFAAAASLGLATPWLLLGDDLPARRRRRAGRPRLGVDRAAAGAAPRSRRGGRRQYGGL